MAQNDKARYIQERQAFSANATGNSLVKKTRAKKHPSAPKRPMSAFLMYAQQQRKVNAQCQLISLQSANIHIPYLNVLLTSFRYCKLRIPICQILISLGCWEKHGGPSGKFDRRLEQLISSCDRIRHFVCVCCSDEEKLPILQREKKEREVYQVSQL